MKRKILMSNDDEVDPRVYVVNMVDCYAGISSKISYIYCKCHLECRALFL